ncbi:MAG: hypothetical protein WCI50_04055 [Actinomycetes bacterium]
MGSSGMKKSRKGGSRQHLDKVGHNTHADAVHEQQLERSAVLDVMGLGNLSGTTKAIAFGIFALITVGAIVALLVLLLF